LLQVQFESEDGKLIYNWSITEKQLIR
jgi:hypothetical protein